MAIRLSNKLIEKAFNNAYYVPEINNKFIKKIVKISLIFILKNYRKIIFFLKKVSLSFFLIFFKEKNYEVSPIIINLSSIKNQKRNFEENGWCFIENFLDEKNYTNIKTNWPSNFFLKFKNNPIKFYNIGLEYLNVNPKLYLDKDEQILNLFPYIKNYYKFLLSNHIKNFVNNLVQTNKNYHTVTIACTTSYPGSFLIPHVDGVAEDEKFQETLNCIHFIDGNDDDVEFSGGTGIYEDNEFAKKIFIPQTLKNSLLVYNSKKPFYHGFDVVKKKNFRKAIAFQLFIK